ALVLRGAHDRAPTHARSRLARVRLRARVAVVASAPVRLGRVRALTRARIARADIVALVLRGAHHRARTHAHASLARVGLRARIAVVARDAVGFRRVRADPGRGVAGAGAVALVESGTYDATADATAHRERSASAHALDEQVGGTRVACGHVEG